MTAHSSREATASFLRGDNRHTALSNERLVLVDEADRPIGEASKLDCHVGTGKLHRAFSLHILTRDGRVLIQRRSAQKLLWPGFWSNSCCSHPRTGENMQHAVRRRAVEELGMSLDAEYLYKFGYSATYLDIGQENEICSVFIGYSDARPRPNPDEIEDFCYLTPDELDRSIESHAERYTPWFRQEWKTLRRDFSDRLNPA